MVAVELLLMMTYYIGLFGSIKCEFKGDSLSSSSPALLPPPPLVWRRERGGSALIDEEILLVVCPS